MAPCFFSCFSHGPPTERVDGQPELQTVILAPVSYLFAFSSLGLRFSTDRPLRVERLSRMESGAKVLGKIGFPVENYFIAKLKEGGETSSGCPQDQRCD